MVASDDKLCELYIKKKNFMFYFPKASCYKNARYMVGTFCALTLCTIASPGFAQSADPKHPALL